MNNQLNNKNLLLVGACNLFLENKQCSFRFILTLDSLF